LLAWLLNGTAHVMVLSPEFQKTLEDMGVRSGLMTTTRTMFDSDGYHLAAECLPDPARPFVLFMSRFERDKGVYELMEAFARIAADYPALTLVMAGDGKEMTALKARAADLACRERIGFPGYVNGLEKWKLLRTCAIFALPTSWGEGMPVSLLEAMSAGKPLLTTKAGGIKYIIADPDNGVVLDAVTVDAVEAALRFLLDNPYYCHGIGQRNAEYAWRCFEASHVTGEIEAVYRAIAGMAAINASPSPVPALSHEG
jgi:glycosyltransferase involved in cell wall biosynthesis